VLSTEFRCKSETWDDALGIKLSTQHSVLSTFVSPSHNDSGAADITAGVESAQ